MVPSERLLLIVAADWRELAGFTERRRIKLPGVRWAFEADLPAGPALLLANGPGRANAIAAVRAGLERRRPAAVISAGFVGALHPDWAVGEIVIAGKVLTEVPRLEYPGALPEYAPDPAVRLGNLRTIDRVAQTAQEKAELRRSGADAVDMEASAVAAVAAEQGLPFFAVRIVSDDAATDFELDFNRARRSDGTFSGWRLVLQAGLRPRRWRHLLMLRQVGEEASRTLANFLRACRFPPQSI